MRESHLLETAVLSIHLTVFSFAFSYKTDTLMKKLFLIIILIFALWGCKKNYETDNALTAQNQVINQKEDPGHTHLNRVYRIDWPNQGDEWCGRPAVDCWDDIIIRPDKSSTFSIFQEFSERYNSNKTRLFFSSDDYNLIFPYMSLEIRDKIVNGEYTVLLRENSMEMNTKIVVVQDGDKDVISVYPLNIQE